MLFTNAASRYVSSSLGITAYPISISLWFRETATDSTRHVCLAWGDVTDGENSYGLLFNADTSTSRYINNVSYNSGSPAFINWSAMPNNRRSDWKHVLLRVDAGNPTWKSILIDGKYYHTDNEYNVTLNAPDRFVLGSHITNTRTAANASFAHVAVWDIKLEWHEMILLSQSISPFKIQRSHLRAYWPLDHKTRERDISGNNYHLSTVGTGTPHWNSPAYDAPWNLSRPYRALTNSPINLINTRDRRASIINHSLPFGRILPTPGI